MRARRCDVDSGGDVTSAVTASLQQQRPALRESPQVSRHMEKTMVGSYHTEEG